MSLIHTQTLDCNTILIVEQMPGVQSAAITWRVPAGHAHDPDQKLGRAAITSEMLLRGSGHRDSKAFADACDLLGMSRSANAGAVFMGASSTFIADRIDEVVPLLVDLVLKPRFESESLEPARDLSLQALASVQDEPQQRAVLAARKRHFPEPMNRTGLGTEQGLSAVDIEDIREGWSTCARPGGSIIAVAGAVEPDSVHKLFNDALSNWSGQAPELEVSGDAPRGYAHEEDDSNQVQIICVHDAPAASDENNMLESVAVSILSGGMSGRLFTEVREKRGLCYAVSAAYRADRDFGSTTGYVGTTPERAQESLEVLIAEFERLRRGASKDEFERAMVGLKSRVVFSGESSTARAGALASDQYKRGAPRSLDEITAQLEAITLDDLNNYLASRSLGRMTIQTLGPEALTPPAR